MEGRNIGRWVNPDFKYTGVAGNSLSASSMATLLPTKMEMLAVLF